MIMYVYNMFYVFIYTFYTTLKIKVVFPYKSINS